ncbi:MAG: Dyp-type peroxidase [Burkholderiaceae bacterium]|jgi:putative iron-dependent peroxidase|nr:Dyp-type peroxidase [Burkholderiaceae bacterium]
MTDNAQPGILQPVPVAGRHLWFRLSQPERARAALTALLAQADGAAVVVGLGLPLVQALERSVPGLRAFPALTVCGSDQRVPSTPSALWIWLRGSEPGELVHVTRRIEQALTPAFGLDSVLDTFQYRGGRDLTGYEDGTENPQGEAATAAALVQGAGPGLDGASFAAVQQWVHDFDAFEHLPPAARDDAIGRRLQDNEELNDAPPSAHVKRTAQESFAPPAFVLRRSMPWARDAQAGLLFLAFGQSLDAFEAQLRRMAGHDDGVVDALFGFSRPMTGAYFWCPPMREGKLDLSALGM